MAGGRCTMKWAVLALVLAFVSLAESGLLTRDKGPQPTEELELQLGEPKTVLDTDGGSVSTWENVQVLQDANVGVARIILHERGLLLPQYSDSPTLSFVVEGEGVVGLLTGLHGESASVRRVGRGDVVAIPKGIPQWWYNSGKQDLKLLAVAHTGGGSIPGVYTVYNLIGEKDKSGKVGGIIHGFSKQILAQAWDVEDKVADQVIKSQKGTGIIKLSKNLEIKNIGERKNEAHDDNSQFQEFVYNVLENSPGIEVENAGKLSTVNKFKLPILKALQLGLSYVQLEKNALLAPSWSPTGSLIVKFLKGSGHVEIARHGGELIISKEVKEGDLYIVPRFFPSAVQAGDNGLEWVAFTTTDLPFSEALAGKTSVFKGLPLEVAAAAFNIDVDLEKQLREKRTKEAFILPPRGKSSGHVGQHEEF